jgi:hypothetical protein
VDPLGQIKSIHAFIRPAAKGVEELFELGSQFGLPGFLGKVRLSKAVSLRVGLCEWLGMGSLQ